MKQFDNAREEMLLAIKCRSHFGHESQMWASWNVLSAIETEAGNLDEAANAKRKAVECYAAYRRDGGENHGIEGRIILDLTKPLLAGDYVAARSFLEQIAAEPEATGPIATFISALQTIVAGSRDRTLADSPDFDYGMAAEILILIDTLEKRNVNSP
jgi:hypothetical protein